MGKIIVVGGGAAGMMAAIIAARNGHKVTFIRKNEKLGKSFYNRKKEDAILPMRVIMMI